MRSSPNAHGEPARSPSVISGSANQLATSLASRVSRRTFFGRVGRMALVLTASSGAVGILSNPAYALHCNCPGPGCDSGCGSGRPNPGNCDQFGHSVTCMGLVGVGGQCPNTASRCGSWTCGCASQCPGSGVRRWVDCCEEGNHCDGANSCNCVNDVDGQRRATCCHKKCYQSPDPCRYIRCRFAECV